MMRACLFVLLASLSCFGSACIAGVPGMRCCFCALLVTLQPVLDSAFLLLQLGSAVAVHAAWQTQGSSPHQVPA